MSSMMQGLTKLGRSIDRMKASERALRTALREMLPYALSRIEDMEQNALGAAPHHLTEARRLYRQAKIRFTYAERALQNVESSPTRRTKRQGSK